MIDFLGREIKVGDIIVYPVRQGSWMELHKGLVKVIRESHILVEIDAKRLTEGNEIGEGPKYVWEKYRKRVPFYSPRRCVVVY